MRSTTPLYWWAVIATTALVLLAASGIAAVIPANPGDTVQLNGTPVATVGTEPLTLTFTPPATQPAPPPPPPPAGRLLPSGGNFDAALGAGGTLLLQRGGTYTTSSTPDVVKDGTVIDVYGTGAKPKVVCKGTALGLRMEGRKNVTVRNITFDGSQTDATGIQIRNSDDVRVEGCDVVGFGGMGVTIEGHSGQTCDNVALVANLIADNWNRGSGHVSGLYASKVKGVFLIDGNTFSTNGYKPGTTSATAYNHNCYLQSDTAPATITRNVFHKGSSYGLQARAGGTVRGNLFVDNPRDVSFGYLNGAVPFPGGVSGEIDHNVFIGGPAGWGLQLGNLRNVKVHDNLFAHDPTATNNIVVVERCGNITGGAELAPLHWTLDVRSTWVYDHKLPTVRVRVTSPGITTAVAVKPPAEANLRSVLGADFIQRARAHPDIAGEVVPACFQAAGL